MAFPVLTDRQALAKVLELIIRQSGFEVTVSPNHFAPMDQMAHSGILIQMPEVTRTKELSEKAEKLIVKMAKIGVFETSGVLSHPVESTGLRPEQIILPLKMDAKDALEKAFEVAHRQAKYSRDGHSKHLSLAALNEVAAEANHTLVPVEPEAPPTTPVSPYHQGKLRIEAEKAKDEGQSI